MASSEEAPRGPRIDAGRGFQQGKRGVFPSDTQTFLILPQVNMLCTSKSRKCFAPRRKELHRPKSVIVPVP